MRKYGSSQTLHSVTSPEHGEAAITLVFELESELRRKFLSLKTYSVRLFFHFMLGDGCMLTG